MKQAIEDERSGKVKVFEKLVSVCDEALQRIKGKVTN
jgi:hypothetical protein